MSGRSIVLVGGPADGKTEWWTGGPVLEVADLPPASFDAAPPTYLTVPVDWYSETDERRGQHVVFRHQGRR